MSEVKKSILDQAEEQFSSIKRKKIDVPEWETTLGTAGANVASFHTLVDDVPAPFHDLSTLP